MSVCVLLLGSCASDVPPPNPRVSLAWRGHLQGAVDGTPAASGNLVFAGSAGGVLAAFDQRTGRELWARTRLGAISDSPAVDAGHIFVGTLAGHVLSLDAASGATSWDASGPPNAAFWSSPLLYRGVVIIGVSSPFGDTPLVPGALMAFDEQTGKPRWTTCLLAGCAPGDGVWSTAAIDASGTAFIGVGNPDDGVIAFDPLTGARKWQVSLYADGGRDLDVGVKPVIVNSAGRELVEVGSDEGTFAALAAANGSVVWSRKVVEGSAVHGLIASPAYDGLNVYAASASPLYGIYALNAATGAPAWKRPTGLPVYSAPAVANGAIVFGSGNVFGTLDAGAVTAFATSDGKELWSYDVHSAVRCGPVIAGDVVIAGDYAGDLFALRVSSLS